MLLLQYLLINRKKAQPRAIKRRPKDYPLLKEPRNQAGEAINT